MELSIKMNFYISYQNSEDFKKLFKNFKKREKSIKKQIIENEEYDIKIIMEVFMREKKLQIIKMN